MSDKGLVSRIYKELFNFFPPQSLPKDMFTDFTERGREKERGRETSM